MGLNRALTGKQYPEQTFRVEAGAARAYALATNEDNPHLVGPDASMVSPMFGVVWLLPTWLEAFFDAQLLADANIGRMVHAGQQMTFLAPVTPGHTIRTVARVDKIEDRGTGEMLVVACRSIDRDERPVLEARSRFYFRGPPDPSRVGRKADSTEIPRVLFEHRLQVAEDQARRYAEASGDHNPIHLDDEMAKAMGFPRTIVHGLCVMALAQKAVLDGAADGRPDRLRGLAVEFAKPVFPGDTLSVIGWEVDTSPAGREIGFVVRNQREQEVLRAGVAKLS